MRSGERDAGASPFAIVIILCGVVVVVVVVLVVGVGRSTDDTSINHLDLGILRSSRRRGRRSKQCFNLACSRGTDSVEIQKVQRFLPLVMLILGAGSRFRNPLGDLNSITRRYDG